MAGFAEVFPLDRPLIGMIHLPPLPTYAGSKGIDHAVACAVRDLQVFEECGVDGVLVENEYDRPHSVTAGPATIAAMTRITRAVVQESGNAVVGCEILLNDPMASLAVAKMSGAQFIRTDYFVDAMTRPGYGEFAIDPAGLIEYRASLDAGDILILADIQVKYASMIAPRPLRESARIASEAGADAVVVTGSESGEAPLLDELREAAAGAGVPVLVGSGLDRGNARRLLNACDGAIVGSALMRDGELDADAVRELLEAIGRGTT